MGLFSNRFNENKKELSTEEIAKLEGIEWRKLKRYDEIAKNVENLSQKYSNLSNDELKNQTNVLKGRVKNGEKLDKILPDAFALVVESVHRTCGYTPYHVQIMAGAALFEGNAIEMRTGEGKTLTALFPAYLNALTGDQVHVMTSNDYLAGRDSESSKPIFNLLGLNSSYIDSKMDLHSKKKAYESDIVYGTTTNFGFDYLRDNLAVNKNSKVMKGFGTAIIDEADSLLLDQAGTPLVLSSSDDSVSNENYLFKISTQFANLLNENDVEIDERQKIAVLKNDGFRKAEMFYRDKTNYSVSDLLNFINNALTAKYILKKDVDYVVNSKGVVLIDKNTGRLLPNQKYDGGLHQAIESKENVDISSSSKNLAQITIQNYLRKYKQISGMSGTIKSSEDEMNQIYNLGVVKIPTNKLVQRKDESVEVFVNSKDKYEAILKDVIETHKKGQPILIGTISIEESELIEKMLSSVGIVSNVLNAKNPAEEAKIIANAGMFGAVTIATDMAGRGTDIKLGGNAEVLAEKTLGIESDETLLKKAKEYYKNETAKNRERVLAVGGLKVIGSSLHKLVRVDDQLRGRAGRQGEVGETKFYTSFDDSIFDEVRDEEWLRNDFINYLTTKSNRENCRLINRIKELQNINESRDFSARKDMVRWNVATNNQFDDFYKNRDAILEMEDVSKIVARGSNSLAKRIVNCVFNGELDKDDENYSKYKTIFEKFVGENSDLKNVSLKTQEMVTNLLEVKINECLSNGVVKLHGKDVLLKTMDESFMQYLNTLPYLKKNACLKQQDASISIREYGEDTCKVYNNMLSDIMPSVVTELLEKTPTFEKKPKFLQFKKLPEIERSLQ